MRGEYHQRGELCVTTLEYTVYHCIALVARAGPAWAWQAESAHFLSSPETGSVRGDDKILLCQKHLVIIPCIELRREMSQTSCCCRKRPRSAERRRRQPEQSMKQQHSQIPEHGVDKPTLALVSLSGCHCGLRNEELMQRQTQRKTLQPLC